jgi:urease alpha subunit
MLAPTMKADVSIHDGKVHEEGKSGRLQAQLQIRLYNTGALDTSILVFCIP